MLYTGKRPDDQLFDCFSATDLNKRLQELMEGLSVKVFRTYNASIVLDRLLHEQEQVTSATVDERKADYDRANKEVRPLIPFFGVDEGPQTHALAGPACNIIVRAACYWSGQLGIDHPGGALYAGSWLVPAAAVRHGGSGPEVLRGVAGARWPSCATISGR